MHFLQRLVIVSGMAGSGKSTALHALEDMGFYCMDNVPLVLLSQFLELVRSHESMDRVAVGVDVRDKLFWDKAPHQIQLLIDEGYPVEVLFLDASDSAILRRYKETRRSHPLDKNGDLLDAIDQERKALLGVMPYVNARIETSSMNVHALRAWVFERYAQMENRMIVNLVSFGFKYGTLLEADMMFDVRFLQNPYFVPALKEFTGKEKSVSDYVFSDADAKTLCQQIESMLRLLLPRFAQEGKRYLTVGIACTGGKHRSVAMVEELYKRLHSLDDFSWHKRHRELV